jgi:hypothetical protein
VISLSRPGHVTGLMITGIQASASVGTFLVFVITAVFALRQLRSSNRSSQLAGLQAVSSHSNGSEFERWFTFVMKELPSHMAERSFRDGLKDDPIDRDVHLEIRLANLPNRRRRRRLHAELRILTDPGFSDIYPRFSRDGKTHHLRTGRPWLFRHRDLSSQCRR